MIRNKRIASFLLCFFFAMTAIIQLLNATPAFAALSTPGGGGNSKFDKLNLSDQLKLIKYYSAFYQCVNQDGTFAALTKDNISSGDWFEGGSAQTGPIADTTGTDGKMDCNDIVKNTVKHLFGWSSYTEAAKAMGLKAGMNDTDMSGTVKEKIMKAIATKSAFDNGSITSGNSDSALNSYLSTYYPGNSSPLRFYDLFTSVKTNSDCKAKQLTDNADTRASTDNVVIWVGNSDGTVKQQVWTAENNVHVDYGWSPDSKAGAGNDGKLSCKQMLTKLSGASGKSAASTYAAYLKANPSQAPDPGDGDDNGGSTPATCNIDGIGWIVCPVLSFMANIVDQSYQVVDAMLTVNAFTGTSGTNDQLRAAWGSMRNIANVAFVIAFLFIIYSQITGFGVSNYGIKKMLPRIIVAAILVNVSYWLCAIAVDISNVFGDSMKSLFSGLGGTFGTGESLSWAKDGNGWAGIVGGIVAASTAAGALLYVGLAALVPALVAAIIAIVTVLLVLVVRQALIILLIVVAPLAFVAFLLPNTQQWFKKWRELFQILLLMYPIIGAIFGASQLASNIVMNSAAGTAGDNEGLKMAIQVMGAAIAIIPLFITPVVMKTAGGVLNNIAGKINNPNKGPFDRMRKGAEGYRDRRKNIQTARRLHGQNAFSVRANRWKNSNNRLAKAAGTGLGAVSGSKYGAGAVGTFSARRAEDKAQKDKYAKIAAEAEARNYTAGRAVGDGSAEGIEAGKKYAMKVGAGNEDIATLVQAYGKQAVREEDDKDIKAERSLREYTDIASLKAEMGTASGTTAAAIAAEIASRGGGEDVQQLLDASSQIDDEKTRRLVQQQIIGNMGPEEFGLGHGDISALKSGEYGRKVDDNGKNVSDGSSYDSKFAYRAEQKMSGQTIAKLQPHDVKKLEQLATNGQLSDDALRNVAAAIQDARSNPNLSGTLKVDAQASFDKVMAKATERGQAAAANDASSGSGDGGSTTPPSNGSTPGSPPNMGYL